LTCIVGLVHEGVTYIGGDSLGSNGHSKTVRNDKKVFHLKDINNAIAGYTSSFRMGQLLMYGKGLIDSRDTYEKDIDHEYLVTKFIPNLIDLFEKGGYSRNNSGEKKGGNFLFAYKDKLYQIESDFQVGESSLKYDACGSGEEFALGSLHSTEGTKYSPQERIRKALQAASQFSVGVAPPYYIVNTIDNEIAKMDS
jgi:ATP-dependent protease HslVU (ClpYQ) peptidase subunit